VKSSSVMGPQSCGRSGTISREVDSSCSLVGDIGIRSGSLPLETGARGLNAGFGSPDASLGVLTERGSVGKGRLPSPICTSLGEL